MEFYTAKEFAKIIKVTREKIYDMIKSGEIKAARLGDSMKSSWRIPKTELQRMHARAYIEEEDNG